VVTDTEELLKATANQTGDRIARRGTHGRKPGGTKKQLAELEENMVEKPRRRHRQTDQLVHENPWKSVGIAAAVGFSARYVDHRRD